MSPFSQPYIVAFAFTYFVLAQMQLILVSSYSILDRSMAVSIMLALVMAGATVFLNGVGNAIWKLLRRTSKAADWAVIALGIPGLILMTVWARLLVERI